MIELWWLFPYVEDFFPCNSFENHFSEYTAPEEDCVFIFFNFRGIELREAIPASIKNKTKKTEKGEKNWTTDNDNNKNEWTKERRDK